MGGKLRNSTIPSGLSLHAHGGVALILVHQESTMGEVVGLVGVHVIDAAGIEVCVKPSSNGQVFSRV